MNDPFLHFFKVNTRDYVYDARSNMIFEVLNHDPQQIRAQLDMIYRKSWEKGIDEISISGVRYPFDDDYILHHMRSAMEELILNVTDRCNFRCRYCIYGGSYGGMRTHRNVDMVDEIAKGAVDEFAERSKELDKVCLGFYGGEPLLRWKMIERLVPYAKERMRDRKVMPSMTTNGWLLTPDKFDFLRDCGFTIMVSMDGGKETHDRNRRTAKNKPTHDVILKNLDALREWDSGYYRDAVSFSYVAVDPFDIDRMDGFFHGNPLTRGHFIMGGMVDKHDTSLTIPEIDTPEKMQRLAQEMNKVISNFARYLQGERETSGIGGSLLTPTLKGIRDRPLSLMDGQVPTTRICMTGVRKLFVTTDGKYHPCEKSESFNIGSVQEGFSEGKGLSLMRDYERMSEGLCDECWGVRLCPACYVTGSIRGELNQDRQRERCDEFKSVISSSLTLYTYLLENRVDLTDRIDT